MPKTQTSTYGAVRASRLVSKSPVFYGWVIAVVGTLAMIMTSPGQTYAISIFIEHFIEDLSINRSLVSTLYTIGTLVGSFAQPVVGRQIDRKGPRAMVVVIATLFGLACIYMGSVQNAIMLGFGFVAIRMLGQGSLSLVSQNVINQWWVRRRGIVMGFSGLMTSVLGVGTFPSLINWLIPHYGWRFTYVLMGLMVLFILVPLGFLFFRNRPEDYGLLPDGGKRALVRAEISAVEPFEENWTLSEAMRTSIFWVFLAGLASISMLATGLFFHMVSIFEDGGLSATVAASVYVPIAVTTAIVNLGSGALVGRVRMRVLMAAALLFQALSLAMVQLLQGVGLALVYGVALGTTMGLWRTLGNVTWAMYFGRQHLGSITGFTATILIAGSALGPMPFGIARDVLGSYGLAVTLSAILPLLLAVVCMFVQRPQKRD